VLGRRSQPTRIVALSEVLAGVVAAPEPSASEVPAAGLSPQWQELVELASDEERALLVDLAGRGSVPVPELGFETDAGVPLDLAWPDVRIAVDLDVDDQTRQELADAGWTWVAPDPDVIANAVVAALKEV